MTEPFQAPSISQVSSAGDTELEPSAREPESRSLARQLPHISGLLIADPEASQKQGPPLLGRSTYLKEKALGSTTNNWSRTRTGIKAPPGKLPLELGPGTVTKFCGSHTVATSPIPHPSSSPRCFPAVMRAVKGHRGSQDGDSQDGENHYPQRAQTTRMFPNMGTICPMECPSPRIPSSRSLPCSWV